MASLDRRARRRSGRIVLSDRALRDLSRICDANRASLQVQWHEASRAELSVFLDHRRRRGRAGHFGDLFVDPLTDGEYERVLAEIEAEELHSLPAGLSDRAREVLRARCGLGGPERTLREVGDDLGLSGERVRQIERRAISKLASAMDPGGRG